MKKRMVICDIDSICRLLKDYCGQVGFPEDGQAVKLMLNPQEHKLAIIVESSTWATPQAAELVKFDIQRFYGLGQSQGTVS